MKRDGGANWKITIFQTWFSKSDFQNYWFSKSTSEVIRNPLVWPWVLMIWVWQCPYRNRPGTLWLQLSRGWYNCDISGSIGSWASEWASDARKKLNFPSSKLVWPHSATTSFKLEVSRRNLSFLCQQMSEYVHTANTRLQKSLVRCRCSLSGFLELRQTQLRCWWCTLCMKMFTFASQ